MAFLVFYIGNVGYLGKKVCIKKLNLTGEKKKSHFLQYLLTKEIMAKLMWKDSNCHF